MLKLKVLLGLVGLDEERVVFVWFFYFLMKQLQSTLRNIT